MIRTFVSCVVVVCYVLTFSVQGFASGVRGECLTASMKQHSVANDASALGKALALIAAFSLTSDTSQEGGVVPNDMSHRDNSRPYFDMSAIDDVSIAGEGELGVVSAALAMGAVAIKNNPKVGRRGFLRAGFLGVAAVASSQVSHAVEAVSSTDIDTLMKKSYNFFKHGVGVDAKTELPFERLFLSGDSVSQKDVRTQPTLVGFHFQFLLDVATGNATVSFMLRQDAVNRLSTLLDTLLSMQANYGWKGLLPTWGTVRNGVYRKSLDAYATGDNFNLSVKVFMALGVLKNTSSLYERAKRFLDNQEDGYREMYDSSSGYFSGVRENGVINRGYKLDRISNEFSPGVAWAVTYYGIDSRAFSQLGAPIRGNNVLSWDGSGFQMSWHQLTIDTSSIPGFSAAHRNFLLTMLKESKRMGFPGVCSPGDDPNGGYAIGGYDTLREGGRIDTNIWNLYALASYYGLPGAQGAIDEWLENAANISGMMSPFGPRDGGRGSVTGTIRLADTILGIDHLSMIVGVHAKGPSYFDRALDVIGKKAAHYTMYEKYGAAKLSRLTKTTESFPKSPRVAARSQTTTQNPQRVNTPTQTSGNIGKTASLTEAGYQQVAKTRDLEAMKAYIRRVADDMGLRVVNEGDLSGFAPYYSGHSAVQSLSRMKQELRSAGWVKPKTTQSTQKKVYGSVGETAPLTETGYKQVANARDVNEMKKYIRRVAKDMGLRITNEGDLSGFAPYYSGHKAVQSLSRMKQELRAASWTRKLTGSLLLPSDDGERKTFRAGVTPLFALLGLYWTGKLAEKDGHTIATTLADDGVFVREKQALIDVSVGLLQAA